MNLTRFFRTLFCSILYFLSFSFLSSFPFIPLSLGALTLPLFGKVASSAKTGVRKTLSNVDEVMIYAKVFLVVATFFLLIIMLFWLISILRRYLRNRKLRSMLTSLYNMQSDLILLRGVKSVEPEQRYNLEKEIKVIIGSLKSQISSRFFKKRLGNCTYKRIMTSFDLIISGDIGLDGQLILVDQWIRTFDFMTR